MAESKDDKSTQAYSALGIGLICLVIGLPLWWKTTEVYRVQLPYSEIYDLASTEVSYSVEIHVVIFYDASTPEFNSEFENKLNSDLNVDVETSHQLSVSYNCHVRTATPDEIKLSTSSDNIYDLDLQLDRLRSYRENGNFTVYFLPSPQKFEGWVGKAVVGTRRAAFLQLFKDKSEMAILLQHVVKNVLINEATILKTFQSTKSATHMQADKESMRSLRTSLGYDITFTLLNPQPDMIQATWDVKGAIDYKESMRSLRTSLGYDITFTLLNPQPDMIQATWDVKGAIDYYLKPLLTAFTEYADVKMKSQYLHLTGLGVTARKDASCGCSVLTSSQLPHIINPIEPYLGSHISNNPNLNFVLYVPTRDQSPLKIFDASGQPSATNAFLSPRWGGLMVYNVDVSLENASLPIPIEIDMKKVMSVFASQLRVLLGVQNVAVNDGVSIVPPGSQIVADWELDLWLREHTIENIAKSTLTLASLADLLDKISNIVINDDIGKQVSNAVAAIQKSRTLLSQAKLKDAFLTSKRALESSEKAFFDPSLLELLYFPEDQKFAIYIPLFLPIGIPIVLSFVQAIKYLSNKSKEKAE